MIVAQADLGEGNVQFWGTLHADDEPVGVDLEGREKFHDQVEAGGQIVGGIGFRFGLGLIPQGLDLGGELCFLLGEQFGGDPVVVVQCQELASSFRKLRR